MRGLNFLFSVHIHSWCWKLDWLNFVSCLPLL